jgi:hypothetical protein
MEEKSHHIADVTLKIHYVSCFIYYFMYVCIYIYILLHAKHLSSPNSLMKITVINYNGISSISSCNIIGRKLSAIVCSE